MEASPSTSGSRQTGPPSSRHIHLGYRRKDTPDVHIIISHPSIIIVYMDMMSCELSTLLHTQTDSIQFTHTQPRTLCVCVCVCVLYTRAHTYIDFDLFSRRSALGPHKPASWKSNTDLHKTAQCMRYHTHTYVHMYTHTH